MTELLIACISFCGTIIGSLSGLLVSSKLTNFRLKQLEDKVETHNRFAMRLPVVEANLQGLLQRLIRLERSEDERSKNQT